MGTSITRRSRLADPKLMVENCEEALHATTSCDMLMRHTMSEEKQRCRDATLMGNITLNSQLSIKSPACCCRTLKILKSLIHPHSFDYAIQLIDSNCTTPWYSASIRKPDSPYRLRYP